MRTKNIVYSLSIALSITLVGGMFPTKVANAANLSYAKDPSILTNKVLTQEETSKVESEINVLKNYHIDTSIIKKVDATANGNEYTLKYKNNDEKVSIKSNDTKGVTIIASDGKKSNVMSFEKDGSIILDGHKVQISQVDQKDMNVDVLQGTKTFKGVKSLSPYGSLQSYDYNQYLSSGQQNIALGESIKNLTATALINLISYVNTYTGIVASLATVAQSVFDVISKVNPTTQYLGCRYVTYAAGSDDYQYYNYFYGNTECTGTYSLQIDYEHFTVY